MPLASIPSAALIAVFALNTAGKHSLKRGIFYAIEKNFYHRTVKSLSAGRSCGKIDARVFEQFSDLFSLSLSHTQLDITYNE